MAANIIWEKPEPQEWWTLKLERSLAGSDTQDLGRAGNEMFPKAKPGFQHFFILEKTHTVLRHTCAHVDAFLGFHRMNHPPPPREPIILSLQGCRIVQHTDGRVACSWNKHFEVAVSFKTGEKVKMNPSRLFAKEADGELHCLWQNCYPSVDFLPWAPSGAQRLKGHLSATGSDCKPNPLTENVSKIASTPVSWIMENLERNLKIVTPKKP